MVNIIPNIILRQVNDMRISTTMKVMTVPDSSPSIILYLWGLTTENQENIVKTKKVVFDPLSWGYQTHVKIQYSM